MRPIAVAITALLSLAFAAASEADGPTPQPGVTVSVDKGHGQIDIGGGSPGSEYLVIGAGSLLHEEIVYQYFKTDILSDDDRDGRLTWVHDQPDATRDLWLAVDLKSGDWDMASGADAAASLESVPAFGLDSTLTRLEVEGEDLQLAVVRPGQGAFLVRSIDGRAHDGDSADDGWMSIAFGAADRSTGFVRSNVYQPGDRLFFVDPERFTVAVTELTQADIDAAQSQEEGI